MIQTITYTLILGKPVIMYMGIITYILILLTMSVAVLNLHFQIRIINFKWHPRLAVLTIIFATLHEIMGMSPYLNI
ncbi:MAG: hypothetical protein PHS92_03015 [Candidatus Gracilibacteria bacterium]|nr:hypothetical protein [Candidatus Gracilibacteria bacterium]